MKNKKIKLGVLAAVRGIVGIPGCQHTPKPSLYDKSEDSIRLEARLLELSKTNYNGALFSGAMCYKMASPQNVDYIYPYCNDTIKNKYDSWKINGIILSKKLSIA